MKRKRIITIEIERDVIVTQRQRTVYYRCQSCGAETKIELNSDEQPDITDYCVHPNPETENL